MWDFSAKRILDLAVAMPLLLLALPLMILLALVVYLDSPGNPLFTQTRIGRHGRHFTLYKLRTFHRDQFGIFPNEEIRWGDLRVTRVGHLLRRCKLDELPQLLNVMLGDMSLVGPRPDVPVQAQHYGEFERQRLNVRPGLTGLAQVSGNTWLSWPERIALDCWYIDHLSMRLDLLILVYTVWVVIRGERLRDDPLRLRT